MRGNKSVKIRVCLLSLLLVRLAMFTGCVTDQEKETADLQLIGCDHNESYVSGNFISELSLFVSNDGKRSVDNASVIISVTNQNDSEIYAEQMQISTKLSSGESVSKNAVVYYGKNDTRLTFQLSIQWDEKQNNYSESFYVEDISSNVELINISHEEKIMAEEFVVTNVTFNLKNTGQEPAYNIDVYAKAVDQDNVTKYNNSSSVTQSLSYNENISETITIDCNILDEYLNLAIVVTWDDGKNEYGKLITLDIIE